MAYTFVTTPERPPGKCFSCGAGVNREWYLDLGEHDASPDPTVPTIYVCDQCVTSIAKDRGLVDETPLLNRIKELEDELFDKTTIADGLKHGLDGLIAARYFDPGSSAVRDLVGFSEGAPDTLEGSQPPGGGVEGRQGEPSEPGDESDLGGIPISFGFDASS